MKPKLLIVELWGLGDLVIATPFIRAAAEKYTVTLLAKPFATETGAHLWPTVEVLPFVAPWTAYRFVSKYGLWRWPWRKMIQLRHALRVKEFDYAVSGRWGDPRDHLLLKVSGAKERLGFPRWKNGHFLTQSLQRPLPLAHRSEYWRLAGSALGLSLPASGVQVASQPFLPPVVLIHTGSRLPLRVWPLPKFLAIVRRLRQENYTVQIACDEEQVNWWRQQGEKVVCPRSITELFACLDQAGIFIGNDSGPGHLAAICGHPTFTLFGPQLSEWFAPVHPAAEWIEGKACPYKPCSDYCRFPTPYCLWDLTETEVWARVQSFAARHLRQAAVSQTAQSLPGQFITDSTTPPSA